MSAFGHYKIIVIGVSAGGLKALGVILPGFKKDFPLPVLLVQHLFSNNDSYFSEFLSSICELDVIEVTDKVKITDNTIYIAPPGYHMALDDETTISLSLDSKVCFSRPSIDVLFESAADVYQEGVIGVILTGANFDGANGIMRIKECGGKTISQNPKTAEVSMMPQSAINTGCVDHVLLLEEISGYITRLVKNE